MLSAVRAAICARHRRRHRWRTTSGQQAIPVDSHHCPAPCTHIVRAPPWRISQPLRQLWDKCHRPTLLEPSGRMQISHDALLSGIMRHTACFTKCICVLACIIGSAALFLTSARKSIRSCPLALCMPPVRDTRSGLSPFTPAVVILCR